LSRTRADDLAHDAMSENAYAEYLSLPALLAQQHPVSAEHDEMLFIVIHQATELWMKLVLHEVGYARQKTVEDDLGPAFKALARVARIPHVLIESWQALATMTPVDYLEFRHLLGTTSGFQSEQYRAIEFAFGRTPPGYLNQLDDQGRARLEEIRRSPGLYDETLRLLARRGLLDDGRLDRDWSDQHELDGAGGGGLGEGCTATPPSTGTCTNWPGNWSISNMPSAGGATRTSGP